MKPPIPARAAVRGSSPSGPSTAAKQHLTLLGDHVDDTPSPRLPPAPPGALVAFLRSSSADDGTASRFCTEGPRLEFGGPVVESGSHVAKCPLRVFANRLQSAISQDATLLLERFQTLRSRARNLESNESQLERVMELCQMVQAASYCVQKWAAVLDPQNERPAKPSTASNLDEAFALMQAAIPRLIVASASLQKAIRAMVPTPEPPPPTTVLSDEQLDAMLKAEAKAKATAETKAEREMTRRGASVAQVYSVIPFLEQAMYQISCLNNSLYSGPEALKSSSLEN